MPSYPAILVSISNTSLPRSVTFSIPYSGVIHRCARGLIRPMTLPHRREWSVAVVRRPITRGDGAVEHVNEIVLVGRLSGEPEWRALSDDAQVVVWRLIVEHRD